MMNNIFQNITFTKIKQSLNPLHINERQVKSLISLIVNC